MYRISNYLDFRERYKHNPYDERCSPFHQFRQLTNTFVPTHKPLAGTPSDLNQIQEDYSSFLQDNALNSGLLSIEIPENRNLLCRFNCINKSANRFFITKDVLVGEPIFARKRLDVSHLVKYGHFSENKMNELIVLGNSINDYIPGHKHMSKQLEYGEVLCSSLLMGLDPELESERRKIYSSESNECRRLRHEFFDAITQKRQIHQNPVKYFCETHQPLGLYIDDNLGASTCSRFSGSFVHILHQGNPLNIPSEWLPYTTADLRACIPKALFFDLDKAMNKQLNGDSYHLYFVVTTEPNLSDIAHALKIRLIKSVLPEMTVLKEIVTKHTSTQAKKDVLSHTIFNIATFINKSSKTIICPSMGAICKFATCTRSSVNTSDYDSDLPDRICFPKIYVNIGDEWQYW